VYDTDNTGPRFVVLAILVALLALGFYLRHRETVRRGSLQRVKGQVVDEVDAGYGGSDNTRWDKVIAFRALDGRDIRGIPRNGGYFGLPVIGRRVPVWYDRRDPQRFEAQVHGLDRAGSFVFLVAIVPALLLLGLSL
jgi:uncharacterized protein DUF3592